MYPFAQALFYAYVDIRQQKPGEVPRYVFKGEHKKTDKAYPEKHPFQAVLINVRRGVVIVHAHRVLLYTANAAGFIYALSVRYPFRTHVHFFRFAENEA